MATIPPKSGNLGPYAPLGGHPGSPVPTPVQKNVSAPVGSNYQSGSIGPNVAQVGNISGMNPRPSPGSNCFGSPSARLEFDQDIINMKDGLLPLQASSNIDQGAFAIFKQLCVQRYPNSDLSLEERSDYYFELAQESYRAARAFWMIKDAKNLLEKGIQKP